jgi:hypothetical protein
VERRLQDRAPECGTTIGADFICVLLYADVLTLLAATPAQLQPFLDVLQKFCAHYRLQF